MEFRLKKLSILGIAAAIVLKLFAFGLSYPIEFRVRGDAYSYLEIANNFDSFSAVLAYAGDRTVGLPFFEFLVRKVLGIFTSTLHLATWIDAICIALLITHIITAWFFSAWVLRTNLVKSRNAAYLLFFFLATYPALIGHTTSPLSDTLSIDLVLLAIISMEAALNKKNICGALLFSGIAAFFFGFSILVRPGSLFGVAAALVVGGVISIYTERRKMLVIGATALGCVLTLAPFYVNCTQKYGSVCLQSPQTFQTVMSAQAGLRGARTLWNKGGLDPSSIPTLPDDIMFNNYFSRCHLTSIIGIEDSSLTGCLVSRPLAIPAFVIKKWIGLFDHFRFTPYLEENTPFWLRWLSRAYDSLSWIGFAFIFFGLFQAARRQNRSGIESLLADNITPAVLVVYSMFMLAQHTALHVEDRYGFPIVPLCAVMLAIYGEKIAEKYRSFGWRGIYPLALYCILAWLMFVAQIVIWDHTTFY